MTQEEQDRIGRLNKLCEHGVNPYPSKGERTHLIEKFLEVFDDLHKVNQPTKLLGRILLFRRHGGLTFAQLQDETGVVQIVLRKDILTDEIYSFLHETIDLGDFIEVTGIPFITKKGERSLEVTHYKLLSKAILPLPEKWHGLNDIEMRFRKRYLDQIGRASCRERV